MPEPVGEPIYLLLDDVLERYAAIVAGTNRASRRSASRPLGSRSALARPGSYAHNEGADLAMQAAVLAHGLAEGQLFIDGNKRISLIAMPTFLEMNGWRVEASDPRLAEWILDLSEGATPADPPRTSAQRWSRSEVLLARPCRNRLQRSAIESCQRTCC